ncbi:MAG: hypothetical protein IPF50_15850 [Proteobacteria bacterium]|nr:hypothetical protein [Pseudomonadota bacterium]
MRAGLFVAGLASACVILAVLAVTSMLNADLVTAGSPCGANANDPDAAGDQQRAHTAHRA